MHLRRFSITTRSVTLVLFCIALSVVSLALIRKGPRDYYQRGNEKKGKGDFAGAISDYTHAVALDPRFASAYNNRGNIKKALGDYRGAVADYNRAIDADPKHCLSYINRAVAERACGDLSAAINDLDLAIRTDPDFGRAYFNRGIANQESGNLNLAVADFRMNYKLEPNNRDYASIWIWLCRAQLSEFEAANSELSTYLFDRAYRLNGRTNDWLVVVSRYLLGQTSQSNVLAAVTSRDPIIERTRKCEYWFFVGMREMLLGDKQIANAGFRECLSTGSRDLTAYDSAAMELKVIETGRKTL